MTIGMKKPSFEITVCHYSASLVMQISGPPDRFFYPTLTLMIIEPVHEISNNVVCAASKASDQPAHTRSLIRAFA